MPSMIAIVHSIYTPSVHAPASHAGLMDNEAERYCVRLMVNEILLPTDHLAFSKLHEK